MSAPRPAGSLSRSAPPGPGQPWTVLGMILWSAEYLQGKGVESGRLDAEHLLASVLGVDRLRLYLDFERPLSPEELSGYRPLLKRRAAREPLQYILGRQPFRELDLEVGPAVLVPRPETEALVEHVLALSRERGPAEGSALDVGTGSGAIALSLAFEGTFASVVATDVDEAALDFARRNRDASGLEDRVELRAGSLFEPLRTDERFDWIVSNPPYVAEADADSLQPEVRDWEPAVALFGGEDGLYVLREIVAGAPARLRAGGMLALEVGLDQGRVVADWMKSTDDWQDVSVLRDYTGRERFVFARGA